MNRTPLHCTVVGCAGIIEAHYTNFHADAHLIATVTSLGDCDGERYACAGIDYATARYLPPNKDQLDTLVEEIGFMAIKCSMCGMEYTPAQLATAYPTAYTPAPGDSDQPPPEATP